MSNLSKTDHGQVVTNHRRGIAWVWIFPALAALATTWLFIAQWSSQGPEIEIVFEEAPGIEPGKTSLYYRGVNSGTVQSVRVQDDLQTVAVRVRLEGFASNLATEETKYWIDRPVVSLTELTGLESIVRGNSLHAGTPGGKRQYQFIGRPKPPIVTPDSQTFNFWLDGAQISFVSRGTPVYHRGVKVGVVSQKTLAPDGHASLLISIESTYRNSIRANSRFWSVPWTAVSLGAGGLKIDVPGVESLLQGGLAYDHFGVESNRAEPNSRFQFFQNESSARASGEPLTVNFRDAQGLRPGQTAVCYLGYPIGVLESVTADPANQNIRAIIRLQPEFQNLAKTSTVFTLIRPQISLEGISGLETLVTGEFLALEPGSGGEPATVFTGRSVGDHEWRRIQTEQNGLKIRLVATNLPNVEKGAPVYHRGIAVGIVLDKTLDDKNQPYLEIAIRHEFRSSLATNSRFWRVPATSIKAAAGVLQVDIASVQSLLRGGVAFDTFASKGNEAQGGESFRFFDDEQAARALSTPIRVRFDSGRGLIANRSQVRYLGVPIGIVESVEPKSGYIFVSIRLDEGFDFLRREGSIFSIVRPNISLQGITGLETLVSGVYIEVVPGSSSKTSDSFVGVSSFEYDNVMPTGLNILLATPNSPIGAGTLVFYKGVPVGQITEKNLSSDGREVVFRVVIDRKYDQLVRANSRFWDSSGLKASVGLLKFRIQTESNLAPAGQVSFSTPDGTAMGDPAKTGEKFILHATPKPEWLNWNPSIPQD